MQVDVLTFNLGITIRGLKAQQQKLSALPVKQEVAGVQSVKNATKARFKMLQERTHAVNAQAVLPTTPMDRPGAMPFLLDHIFGINKFENVNPDLFVLVKRSIKLHVHPGRTQKQQGRYHALSVHRVRMQLLVVP